MFGVNTGYGQVAQARFRYFSQQLESDGVAPLNSDVIYPWVILGQSNNELSLAGADLQVDLIVVGKIRRPPFLENTGLRHIIAKGWQHLTGVGYTAKSHVTPRQLYGSIND